MVENHLAYGVLPVQLAASDGSDLLQYNVRTLASSQNISTLPLVIHTRRAQQQNPLITSSGRPTAASKSMSASRHLRQHIHNYSHNHHHHQQQLHRYQRPRVIRASEYKNLRQVVPALRRQRDVGKVEVVTEAARYIDHLHKTLIERFVLCGIPDSLKDILGTDDANELNSQHIMNLVTKMASKQQATTPASGRAQQRPSSALIGARESANGSQRAPTRLNCAPNSHKTIPRQLASGQQPLPAPQTNASLRRRRQQQHRSLVARGNQLGVRRRLPIVGRLDSTSASRTTTTTTTGRHSEAAETKSKY